MTVSEYIIIALLILSMAGGVGYGWSALRHARRSLPEAAPRHGRLLKVLVTAAIFFAAGMIAAVIVARSGDPASTETLRLITFWVLIAIVLVLVFGLMAGVVMLFAKRTRRVGLMAMVLGLSPAVSIALVPLIARAVS